MISYLNPASLTEKDVERILRAGERLPFKETPASYVEQWTQGRCQFWEIAEPGDGLVITRLNRHGEDTELFLELVTGRELLKHRQEILKDLETMAFRAEAKWIGCQVTNRALEKTYRKMGFEPIGTRMRRAV